MDHRALCRLLASMLVLNLAACMGASPSPEPIATVAQTADASGPIPAQPTQSTTPTEPPVAVASPTAEPFTTWPPEWDPCRRVPYTGPLPPKPIVPRAAVRVAVAELNLRFGPCTAAKKLATLTKGTLLVVSDDPYGPVKGNGYAWYSVVFPPGAVGGHLQPLPGSWFPDGTDTDGGWIAATDGTSPFVETIEPRCPAVVDLENVIAMLEWETLACFDAPIEVEGTFGCGGCGGSGGPVASPTWLADAFNIGNLRIRWGDWTEYQPIAIFFKPDGPAAPPEGSVIRVTLHVDDPAAQTCSFDWVLEDPAFQVPKQTAVAWCRERFVVDAYTVMGSDPNYPG